MLSSREDLPKAHTLVGEIEILQCRISELKRKIVVAERNLNWAAADYQKFSRWEEEASKKYNSAESRLDHYSTYGDRLTADQLKKDVNDAKQGAVTRFHAEEEARDILEKLQLELQAVEKNLVQKMWMKSDAEETTKKLFKSLGLSISTKTITLTHFREDKSLEAPASTKTSREEILQLQKELTAEIAEMQKRYNQKYEQIEEKLKADESQLHSKRR